MEILAHIVDELSHNRYVFQELFRSLPEEMVIWKQSEEKWCLQEIICHLYDEEREDFRARVRHVLTTPDQPLTPIDPQGWVLSRAYMQQKYQPMLDKFLNERDESIQWLKSLKEPDWDQTYQHPKLGPMSAALFLVNWLAHDYLHIRQVTRLKYDYLKTHSAVPMDYAGNW